MELECQLTQEQEDTYNEAVSFWKVCSETGLTKSQTPCLTFFPEQKSSTP